MKRSLLLVIALVIASAVILVTSARSSSVAATPAAVVQASTAPDFTVKDLNGRTVRLSDLRGKAVVLNFWATWCPPCRHEIPWFIDLQKKYGPQGLEVVGISLDESSPAAVAQFAKELGVNYTIAMANTDLLQRYGGIRVLPTTIYIGRDGKVLANVPGLMSRDGVEQAAKAALATPAPPRT